MNTGYPSNGQCSTPIFGLSRDQLQPIVERIAGGRAVASYSISIDNEVTGHYGYSADKLIPTITYLTCSGSRGSVTAFVKLFHKPGEAEARHYLALAACRAPIPEFYGSLTTRDRREMIFLEYLRPVDDFMGMLENEEQFRQFLSVVARFNAISPAPEHSAALPRRDFAPELSEACTVLERIWKHAAAGDLGDDLRSLCSGRPDRLDALRELAASLAGPIAGMEVGFLHNDFYPDSVAWRRETGDLVVVDLESVGFGPRFYDAARWLGAPDKLQQHASKRSLLAKHYLAEYGRWSGREAEERQFLSDARLLWQAGVLTMLFFFLGRSLDGRVDWTDDREEGRRRYRAELHTQLVALLRQAGQAA